MRIFRFDSTVGHAITAYGSANVSISGILRLSMAGDDHIQIGCMHIGPGGEVGAHPAVGSQLFLVVAGEGWVRGAVGGALGPRQPIAPGVRPSGSRARCTNPARSPG